MKNVFNSIKYIFTLDTTGEDESNKLVVVLRLTEFILTVYCLVCGIYSYSNSLYTVAGLFLTMSLLYCVLMRVSYKIRTRIQVILLNIFVLGSVLVGVLYLGTSLYMQNLLLLLLVVDYFAEYGHYKAKALISAILCFIFMMIVLLPSINAIAVPVTNRQVYIFRAINVAFMFISMSVISYVYSSESQHLEGKLLEYNNKLKKEASTDALTGLCNRRTAMDFIDELINESADPGFCVCMCDIDFFKKVNDSYGHDIGDKVLCVMANTMITGFPKNCLISRWGGEEFLVIFPRMNGDDAKMLLDIMRTKIKGLEFSAGEKKFNITVTYGLAEYGFDGDGEKLVKQADEKLYMGKQNGRDQVVF